MTQLTVVTHARTIDIVSRECDEYYKIRRDVEVLDGIESGFPCIKVKLDNVYFGARVSLVAASLCEKETANLVGAQLRQQLEQVARRIEKIIEERGAKIGTPTRIAPDMPPFDDIDCDTSDGYIPGWGYPDR